MGGVTRPDTLAVACVPFPAEREIVGIWASRGGPAAHVTATDRAVELVEIAAAAAADKLASDIIAYDVSEQLVITDAFLLCSASNDRQVRAIVDEIEEKLKRAGAKPARREGEREARWVLLDYIDIVIHVQHAEERVYYSLERLWKDCPIIPLPEPVGAAGAGGRGSGQSGAGDGKR
jgi:ribosome-associated protein